MTTRFTKYTTILAVFILLLGLAGSAQAGKETMKDGVLHVINDSRPSQGVETLNLEEIWRVGGEDSEDFFGLITQVVIGDEGNVYLLDTRLSEVPVYSPDGERIDTLSREGDGPGETRGPTNLIRLPDGNLGLVQMFPGKVTMIDLEGGPLGIFEVGGADPTAGGFMMFYDCFSGGDRLIVTGEAIAQNPPTGQIRTNYVAAYDMAGNEEARFIELEREMDFTRFEFDEDELDRVDFRKACSGADGRVYLAPKRNQYVIHVYTPDGQLERIIQRDYEHRDRSERDYNAVKTAVEAQLAQLPGSVIKVSRTEPDVNSLMIGPDGNLWVTSSRSGFEQPEGILATFDVFSPDGHFIKQVQARCDGNGLEDAIFFTSNGTAVVVTGFTEAVRSLQSGGAAAAPEEDEEEAAPMEVIYLKLV
jgi:hypothetical protein